MKESTKDSCGFYRWGSVFLMSLGDLYVHFSRNAVGVMRTAITDDISMNDTVFGTFSAAFTYAYMLCQVLAGSLADRIGVKKVFVTGTLIAAAGSAVLGFSDNMFMLFLGRALMGAGCAVPAMGLQKLVSAWFKHQWVATIVGFACCIGSMGAVLSQYPLAAWLGMTSWKTICLIEAGILLVIAICIFLIMRDSPLACEKKKAVSIKEPVQITGREIVRQIKLTLINKKLWPAFFAIFIHLALQHIFVSTWAVTYLEESFELSRTQAAGYTTCMLAGTLVACAFIGIVSDLLKRRKAVIVAVWAIHIAAWFAVTFFGNFSFSTGIMWPVMFGMGMTGAVLQMLHAYVRDMSDPRFLGITVSVLSTVGMVGGALGPMLSGMLLDHYRAAGLFGLALFRAAFIPCIAAILISMVIILVFMKETRCQNLFLESAGK